MSRGLTWAAWALLLGTSPAWAQISVTVPSGTNVLGPADDYATRTFQDPWDMNEYTDLGWFTLGSDSPPANLANVTVAGGIFSATPTSTDPNFFLLDSYIPGTVNVGKQGKNTPIDASKYRVLMLRMYLASAPPGQNQVMQILWSNNTIYPSQPGGGIRTSNSVPTNAGWWYYYVDLVNLGSAIGPGWSGLVDSLRLDPTQFQVAQIQVDWARLMPRDDANLVRTAQWTGATQVVDVFLDNNNNAADGTLGQVAASYNGGAGATKSFSFYFGGLAPGDYYVALRAAGPGNPLVYSPGFYRVVALPTITVTAPNAEGSTDDFATVQLNNAWDMNALADADLTRGLTGLRLSTIPAVNEAGQSLGNVQVLSATSTAPAPGGVGDPEVYTLYSTVRGVNYRIDTDRYRVLVAELGLPGPRDVAHGSIARVVWRIADEPTAENVSGDIVINHRAGVNVLHKLVLDMKTLSLETDPGGSPSTRGWINGGGPNPGVDHFRLDPHEFSPPTTFAIRRIKLAAFERANTTYQVRWSFSNPSALGGLTVRLIADTDKTGCDGTTIASGLSLATGLFNWPISNDLFSGQARYMCAQVLSGATVINQAYSRWPVVRDSTFGGVLARLVPDRSVLRFGAVNSAGILTSQTPSQQVAVSQIGGSPAPWSVAGEVPWVSVSPAIGSGTGTFTVSIVNPGGLPKTGLLRGKITITSTEADNAPQYIDVFLQIRAPGTTSAPFGFMDTPTNGITGVTGQIPVTGWTLDDIGVDRVELYRDRVAGDPPPRPNGKIFIGYGAFVPGVRPDVEALYPALPMSYRAAWGYMLLTNLLPDRNVGTPSGGNGPFTLYAYAIDREAKTVLLGSKTITLDNAHATKPFGTIDTPGQSGTVSGQFVNFGWILTPQPGFVPTNGSTISVRIDGVPVGQPVYNQFRSDIATLFPGYANSNGAVGYFYVDTTSLANGLHTIMWFVTDSQGYSEGIGSRYFFVLN